MIKKRLEIENLVLITKSRLKFKRIVLSKKKTIHCIITLEIQCEFCFTIVVKNQIHSSYT